MTWLFPRRRRVPDDGHQTIQLNTKAGAASTPVDGNLPVSVNSSATHVHEGDIVGIRTLPVWKPIEQANGRRRRCEQCHLYAVFVE